MAPKGKIPKPLTRGKGTLCHKKAEIHQRASMARKNNKKIRDQARHQQRIKIMRMCCDKLGIQSNNSVAIARKILQLQGRQLEHDRQHYLDSVMAAFCGYSFTVGYTHTPQKVTKKTKRKKRKNETFYESREWRELRYEALKKHGRKCLCCGQQPPDVVLHVDHIKPRSKYPELELDINNLQILCKDCNLGKSNTDSIDYR